MSRMVRYNAGFTLVELMVVSAIIGILANRATVKVMPALYKGKRAGLTAYIRSELWTGISMYYIDNGKFPDPLGDANFDPTEFLKGQNLVTRNITQMASIIDEPMSAYYIYRNGTEFEYTVCFEGIGATWLEEPCVLMKTDGRTIYIKQPQ